MKENDLVYESDTELDLNLIDPTEMIKKTNTKKEEEGDKEQFLYQGKRTRACR